MSNYNISHNQYKKYSYYLPQRIGPGALANDQVRQCYKCNEPIAFKRLTDGSWKLLNYFTGEPHEHRQSKEELN